MLSFATTTKTLSIVVCVLTCVEEAEMAHKNKTLGSTYDEWTKEVKRRVSFDKNINILFTKHNLITM